MPEKVSMTFDRVSNVDWKCDKVLDGDNKGHIFCCPSNWETPAGSCIGSQSAIILSNGDEDYPGVHISNGLKVNCDKQMAEDSAFGKLMPEKGKTCFVPKPGVDLGKLSLL